MADYEKNSIKTETITFMKDVITIYNKSKESCYKEKFKPFVQKGKLQITFTVIRCTKAIRGYITAEQQKEAKKNFTSCG
jgi:hypothetical protein